MDIDVRRATRVLFTHNFEGLTRKDIKDIICALKRKDKLLLEIEQEKCDHDWRTDYCKKCSLSKRTYIQKTCRHHDKEIWIYSSNMIHYEQCRYCKKQDFSRQGEKVTWCDHHWQHISSEAYLRNLPDSLRLYFKDPINQCSLCHNYSLFRGDYGGYYG